MVKRALILFFASMIFCTAAAAAKNPFLTPSNKEEEITVEPKRFFYPPAFKKAISLTSKAQRQLHEKMSVFARQLKNRPSVSTLMFLFLIAFLYGVVHAAGPGHGKVFVVSYFISSKAEVKKGVFLGSLIAFLHAGTAVLLVSIIYSIVSGMVMHRVEDTTRTISLISYAMITLIGLIFLCFCIKNKTRLGAKSHSHDEDLSDDSNRSLISVALAVGVVPCPGTVLLLIFSMSMDMLFLGILLALTIAAGMAVTISLAGVVTILSRQFMLNVIFKTRKTRFVLTNGLELAGCIAMVLLGGSLFASAV